jgi:hypothetical protein
MTIKGSVSWVRVPNCGAKNSAIQCLSLPICKKGEAILSTSKLMVGQENGAVSLDFVYPVPQCAPQPKVHIPPSP